MGIKVALCIFAVLGQSFAGLSWSISQPSCDCGSSDSAPVYNSEGVVISEIDIQPNKPVYISSNIDNYKPKSTYLEIDNYQPSLTSTRYLEKDNYQPSCKSITRYSAKDNYEYQPSYKSTTRYSEIDYQPNYEASVSSAIPNNGGALLVTSSGPIAPFGIGAASDLSLAGDLEVSGVLPYLSAVVFEGQFDTNGAAAVEYGCGDCVAITENFGGYSDYPVSSCGYSNENVFH